MLRMTKQTDYGIVLLSQAARQADRGVHNAPQLAAETRLPLPMVTKILRQLAAAGLLASHRGTKGGYTLTRRPEAISVADIVEALEGRLGLTECSLTPFGLGSCDREPFCATKGHTQKLNEVVWGALQTVTLADLAQPAPPVVQPRTQVPEWIAATPVRP
ncbi:MAG TPA: SUF system Fe-S cluster assembly regulator [bacterium]|nr:SUF system Fe-S cluster assembly regulator [bacterium]